MAGGGDSQAGWRPAAVGVPAQGHTSPPRGREEAPVPEKDQTEHAEAGRPHLKGARVLQRLRKIYRLSLRGSFPKNALLSQRQQKM